VFSAYYFRYLFLRLFFLQFDINELKEDLCR